MKIFLNIIIILLSINLVYANLSIIKGKVVDEENLPIAGANVLIKGTILGAATDVNGLFEIENLPEGIFILSITMIGYEEYNLKVQIEPSSLKELGTVILNSTPLNASPIVVTASRHEQNIREVPMSISTLDKNDINARNSTSIDQALQYVPGVYMNQEQISIRGSTGYSRGIGSRVTMLVDGVPFITGDTQGIVPEALAINQVESIEIVKGASSALYGSNAIGGVINVISKSITEKPSSKVKLYGGFYDNPYNEEWKWWSKSRYFHGIKGDYSRKIKSTGFRIAFSKDKDESYRQNDWSNRINFGAKVEHEISSFQKFTLTGNYMDLKRGNFLYWKNLSNALIPPKEDLGEEVHSTRFFLSPAYRIVLSDSNYFSINGIWFHNKTSDNVDADNHSYSDNLNITTQYNTAINNHFFTFGFSGELNQVSSNVFGKRQGLGLGLYVHDEYKWQENWLMNFGMRFDYFELDKIGSKISVNPKFGLVFNPNIASSFRFNLGTGFRAPAMAEAFTSISANGLMVIPNENLEPEKNYSGELGWNQIVGQNFNIDLAIFYNRYFDLIESDFTEDGKVMFRNIRDAEIFGTDFYLNLLLFDNTIISKIGYTFTNSLDLSVGNKTLKYRPKHILYTNVNLNYKNFTAGLDYRYLSRYEEIDEQLAVLIPDGDTRIAIHVVDLRFSQSFLFYNMPIRTTFQINNLLQYNYVDFIGTIASIRNFVLTFETSL